MFTTEDLPLLAEWLSRPHVRETEWGTHRPRDVDADFGISIHGNDKTNLWLFNDDDEPTGMIQDYVLGDNPEWLADLRDIQPDPGAIGIDYLIGEPDRIGRGLGPRMIGDFVGTVWDRFPEAPLVLAAVDAGNRRSWRSLEKAGFRRSWTGVLPSDLDSGAETHVYILDRP
ncbi:MAG TPA: GNAT family N-acetyltransferase [Acidimicrobiia bacterium]